jgi:hypothetical protein
LVPLLMVGHGEGDKEVLVLDTVSRDMPVSWVWSELLRQLEVEVGVQGGENGAGGSVTSTGGSGRSSGGGGGNLTNSGLEVRDLVVYTSGFRPASRQLVEVNLNIFF